jgi:hypothetical protein
MSDESDDLRALKLDPDDEAIAELFEPEMQDEVRVALLSMRHGANENSKARKAAETRSKDLHRGCNVTTRPSKNPY